MEKLVQENEYGIVVPLFYTDLDIYQQCQVLQKIEEFKDYSRPLSDFPVLFKADLIFKDFSRKPSKFKYFSSLWEPCIMIILFSAQNPFSSNSFKICVCKCSKLLTAKYSCLPKRPRQTEQTTTRLLLNK